MRLTPHNLRRAVVPDAQLGPCPALGIWLRCSTKVDQHCVAAAVQDDVVGLEVTMHPTELVHRDERGRNLSHVHFRMLGGQEPPWGVSQVPMQRLARQIFEDKEQFSAVLAGAKETHEERALAAFEGFERRFFPLHLRHERGVLQRRCHVNNLDGKLVGQRRQPAGPAAPSECLHLAARPARQAARTLQRGQQLRHPSRRR
mmetsp:Transcript_11619/g.29483  ORF Transcript_11619/g.29483 Transcript_11619/m.29483 type:complete len:201 (-) Transcript_11619:112-714(-)